MKPLSVIDMLTKFGIYVLFSYRTNLPKEVMAFPDMPFDPSLQSFITHEDVLDYLEKYAAKFNLFKYIKVQ